MKELTLNRNAAARLSTPSDLKEKARHTVCDVINPLIADAFALFIKTKNYHWHVSGSHYREYHLLFDEQANQIFAMVDVLAERVRKLGGATIHSVKQISQLQNVIDDNEIFVDPIEMVRRLMAENVGLTERLRMAHKICDDHNDIATASVLEVHIDETERRTWFLFETQAE